jgi:hypothetical protein
MSRKSFYLKAFAVIEHVIESSEHRIFPTLTLLLWTTCNLLRVIRAYNLLCNPSRREISRLQITNKQKAMIAALDGYLYWFCSVVILY